MKFLGIFGFWIQFQNAPYMHNFLNAHVQLFNNSRTSITEITNCQAGTQGRLYWINDL